MSFALDNGKEGGKTSYLLPQRKAIFFHTIFSAKTSCVLRYVSYVLFFVAAYLCMTSAGFNLCISFLSEEHSGIKMALLL